MQANAIKDRDVLEMVVEAARKALAFKSINMLLKGEEMEDLGGSGTIFVNFRQIELG